MSLVSYSNGSNILSRCYDQPPDYPDPTAPVAYVEIYWRARNADEPAPPWKYETTVAPGAGVEVRYNPDIDRDVEVAPMPYGANGQPAFATIDDAFDTIGRVLPHQREFTAPVIGQGEPTTTPDVTIKIGITGFTRFARFRRIVVSASADMSDPLVVLTLDAETYVARELPRYFILKRTAGTGGITTEAGGALLTEDGQQLETEDGTVLLPQTVYVTIAHSGGTAWTPPSNILEVRFAASDGTGGSEGDGFDPTPRDEYNLDEA